MKEYGVGVVRKEYYRLLVALCHAGGGVAHRFSIHLSTDNTHTHSEEENVISCIKSYKNIICVDVVFIYSYK